MKNVSHKKRWNFGTNPTHLEPTSIPLIKETCYFNSDKDLVNIELRGYPASSMLDLYESKIALFYNVNIEDFLFFIFNFNMTLAATGMLNKDAKMQYLCTLLCGEALHQVDLLYADVENTEILNVEYYIKGLALYFSM